jgi:YD repeat-containing protein
VHGWLLYDNQNRVIASVNGEGYLTETIYDINGNVTQKIAYANKALLAPQAIAATTQIGSLRPASSPQDQVSSWAYTDLNQIKTATDYQGTVTQYTYDSVGHLIQTDQAFGTAEVRTLQTHYDKQGRVIAELTAEGSAALAALSTPTQAQIDAIWTSYGTSYAYDAAGRRISMTDANGNKTLFYYSIDGDLKYTINAMGEVVNHSNDAFREETMTVRYGTRLSSATLATLTGGLINSTINNAIAAITNAAVDSVRSMTYNHRGLVSSSTDIVNATTSQTTTYTYDGFGELVSQTTPISTTSSVTANTTYDKRGQVTQTQQDVGGLNLTTSATYDAFGRVTDTYDGNNNHTHTTYDRLGRVVQITDALNINRYTSYDAFSRVFKQTDALNNVTTTSYDDVNRTMTVTTAEGISMVTTHNRHGETVQVKDGNGNTTSYTYDKNGNLKSTTNDALHISDSKDYDHANRVIDSFDGNNHKTAYTYDAANRLLTRIVDPAGLALKTTMATTPKGKRLASPMPTMSLRKPPTTSLAKLRK